MLMIVHQSMIAIVVAGEQHQPGPTVRTSPLGAGKREGFRHCLSRTQRALRHSFTPLVSMRRSASRIGGVVLADRPLVPRRLLRA